MQKFVIFIYVSFIYAGHFLPEEDDKFFERVQTAVEEEEREALAAAETDAAKDAIATAEESRKAMQNQGKLSKESNDESQIKENNGQIVHSVTEEGLDATDEKKSSNIASEGQNYGGAYDPLANLPIEFYHYYHGSNNDMGTLIEVILTTFFNQVLHLLLTKHFLFVSLEFILVARNCA
jgi:hypothetical protein